MVQYKVINRFEEGEHDGHVYKPGDIYPAEGKKLVKARAEFLMKRHEEYNVAFLEEIKESKKPSTTAKSTQKTTKKESEEAKSTEKSDE